MFRASNFAFALLGLVAACRSNPSAAPPQHAAPTTNRPEFAADPRSWKKIHSARFALSIPLPDAKSWSVDDRSRAELVAAHGPTHSLLVARTFTDPELVTRARCEELSRQMGLVPNAMQSARTIDDQATTGPDDFDTRAWVAIRSGKKDGELVGDLFVFAAHIRKCIFVHYATIVPSEHDAEELSDRLAVARHHLPSDLSVDVLDAAPRETPR